QDLEAALAVLIHGDAAFPGEGIVAETLNLSRLEGYQTGGTIHLIVNNQVGFTTEPSEGRSTLYAGDLAKGFEIPIVHVNADDPEACLAAARLACAYRDRFHKDFMIDLIGYRRWGHNEADEPAFTQPRMYQVIRSHPTVRQMWARELERQRAIPPGEAEALLGSAFRRLEQARSSASDTAEDEEQAAAGGQGSDPSAAASAPGAGEAEGGREVSSGVRQEGPTGQADENSASSEAAPPEARYLTPEGLRELNEALLTWPAGFSLNRRLERPLERRRAALGP